MSNLTAEQRQRMEENRRKALQKRANLIGSGGGSHGNSSNSGSSASSVSSSHNAANLFYKSPLKANNTFSESKPKASDGGTQAVSNSGSGISQPVSNVSVTSASKPFVSLEEAKRIDENRRKALEKRENSFSSNSTSPTFSSSSNAANLFYKSPSKTTNSVSDSKSKPFDSGTHTISSGSSGTSQLGGNVPVAPTSKPCLSLEEAKRMEENRRKALEKRAAQQASGSPGSAGSESVNTGQNQIAGKAVTNFYKSSNSATSDSDKTLKQQSHPFSITNKSTSSNSFSASSGSKSFNNPSGSTFYKGNQNPSKQQFTSRQVTNEDKINTMLKEADEGPKPILGKSVTGTFRLMSRERFVVDAGFHAPMIEIFKTMPSRKYDPESRKWNFDLSDHDKLAEALKPLRPAACVCPLPIYVRKTLQTVAKQLPSSCVDLFGLDPKLLESLMPFQHDGVCFGVSLGGRVMIADDMGLGKTIQALGIAAYYRREWPLLIVTPSSVRYSWLTSIERWLTDVNKHDIRVLNTGKDYIDDAQIVITSYDLMARRAKEFLDLNFQIVIMDESHMIKSFKTARFKAAAPIMKRAKRVILLSGTPALSRPSELYTQISGIDPTLFPSFNDFGIRYCAGKQLPWGWDFSGSSNMEELQIILEARLMIRRLKSEVLSQLPAKQRMMVILDPGMIKANTKAMADAARQFGSQSLKGVVKHGALLQFFAESAVAKLKAVSEYVKELLEGESKFIVFAHHRVMLDKLCDTCENVKAKYIRIDGRTSGDARQQLVNKFQTCDDVRVAVLSITAANAGITLTAAQLVVFAEIFWNPGILIQAEDRAHRIGQQDSVTVQYLLAKETADDHIWPLVQSKLEVLSTAGLSKETRLEGDSAYQKEKEQNTIEKYLMEMGDDFDFPEDPTDYDAPQPQGRKEKKEGLFKYFSQAGVDNDDENDEPETKRSKV